MSGIQTTALVKEYPNGVRGVDGVDVEIHDGEFFALLGPSGCGKTTLLRSIAGLEAITEGSLRIGDRDLTHAEPGDRGVAMVFQDYALFPHMDVGDNIAYPLKIRRVRREERRATAEKVASGLSLDGLIARRPGQLSGGQQQRVALARAVATRPDVLLLDEPLSNLDARLRLEARTFLKELQRDLGVTTVFVTHDQAEALALADRIAVMKLGRLQQVGTPREVFGQPANTFVAGFIGSNPMNLLPGRVTAGAVEVAGTRLPLPGSAAGSVTEGQQVVWGIRPEYLRWVPAAAPQGTAGAPPSRSGPNRDQNPGEPAGAGAPAHPGRLLSPDPGGNGPEPPPGIPVEVSVTESLGATVLVTAHAGDHKVQLLLPEDHEPVPGAQGWVVAQPTKTLLFDAETTERVG